MVRRVRVRVAGRDRTAGRSFDQPASRSTRRDSACGAEREGFEPSTRLTTRNGFRDRRIRPLCHLSERAEVPLGRQLHPRGVPTSTLLCTAQWFRVVTKRPRPAFTQRLGSRVRVPPSGPGFASFSRPPQCARRTAPGPVTGGRIPPPVRPRSTVSRSRSGRRRPRVAVLKRRRRDSNPRWRHSPP